MRLFSPLIFLSAILCLINVASAAPADYFGIQVVDDATGRGVPLVELTTTYEQRYYTDSNGYVAFFEPGLMNQDVWFGVESWGYEGPAGPFGSVGVALKTVPGTVKQVKVKRLNLAERLYRQTGYGIYRDTVLLGKKPPIQRPLVNGLVMGSDTVQTAVYRGKMRWFWQDTDRLSFFLGNFHMTGATSPLPGKLDPYAGIYFDYFIEKPGGFVKEMAKIEIEGSHPIWIDGLMVVPDAAGRDRLVARYAAVNQDMSPFEVGLVSYDDAADVFRKLKEVPNPQRTQLYPGGHPFKARDGGVDYYYTCTPFPAVRVRADLESASDLSAYEGFTCLRPDSDEPERDAAGKLKWSWRRGAEPLGPGGVERLVKAGKMKAEESPYQLRDADGGGPVAVAGGSVAWNPYLKRWTFLFGQSLGATVVGEIWFATANAPEGPWGEARKVATHALKDRDMDLYNPMQHPELARDGGRYVYFEGTFVNTFSGTKAPVPLYNYNNVMYRLDLADPRLKLADPPPGLSEARPAGQ